MAVTKTISARGSKNHHTFELTMTELELTQDDITRNRSRISYTLRLIDDSNWYWNNWGSQIYCNIYGNGTLIKYETIPTHNTSPQTITTDMFDVPHESDGSKTMTFSFSIVDNTGQSYTCGNANAESSMTLTTIPRGFTQQPSLSPTNLQETTLDVSWSTSETASQIKIYLDDTLVETKSVDGKSGTFRVSGTAGSGPHSLYYKATRKDTGVEQDSITYWDWSFYDYPHITNVSSNPLTIGNEQTLTIYNPLGRNITVKMNKNNASGTQLYSGTTSSKGNAISYKFTPNATTLYNSIPNNSNSNCVYSVVYGNVTRTSATSTYEIKGDELPTFNANNWSYTANLTSLTNNNQVAIDNYSTITATINTAATSNYGSTIDRYVVEWGNATPGTISGSSTSGSVSNGNGNTLVVTVFDKRGLARQTSKTITNIPYTNINISNINTPRTNGVEAETKLNLSGTFYNAKFGTNGVQNALYSAKYYTSTNGTTWSSGYTIPTSSFTTSNNYFNLNNYVIHANGSSGGFTIGTRYYVKVEIKDAQGLLYTAVANSTITDGKIARDVYKDSNGDYHEGINGLADSNYVMKVNGTLATTDDISIAKNGGTVKINGHGVLKHWSTGSALAGANGDISFRPKGTDDTTNQMVLNADGTLNLNKGALTNLILKRTEGANACAIQFQNTNGALGSIGMTGSANGYLKRFNKDYSSNWDIIDRSVVTNKTSKTYTDVNTNIPTNNTLAYWNGAYNSSNSSNLTYAHQGTIQCKPTSLYDNSTGSTGNVTLSQTAANFTFLQIFYYIKSAGNINYGSTCVFSPNNKRVGLVMTQSDSGSLVIGSCIKTISGTSITNVYNGTYNSFGRSAATNEVYIYKVFGWK